MGLPFVGAAPFYYRKVLMAIKTLTPSEEMALIRNKMSHFSVEAKPKGWMDTGSPRLNSVLGVRDKGIPWGRIIELFGPESNGKSGLAYDLMAIAQASGAFGIWYDAERSYTRRWARKRGCDVDNIYLVKPYLGFFGGKKPKYDKKGRLVNEPTLSPAEVLCDEVSALIRRCKRKDADRPVFLVVDSVTALETQYEMDCGMEDSNMKSNTELSRFLSKLMKHWVSLFATHDVTATFINQLRTKPGVSFGDPEYTPGGKAVKFYAHIRANVRRVAGGKIMHGKDQIGIQSTITNYKNKTGGLEREKIGYKLFFDGNARYLEASKLVKAGKQVEV